MSERIRQGLGLLCVALIALVISLAAGINAEPLSTGETIATFARAAAILFGIGGLIMLAAALLSRGKSPTAAPQQQATPSGE